MVDTFLAQMSKSTRTALTVSIAFLPEQTKLLTLCHLQPSWGTVSRATPNTLVVKINCTVDRNVKGKLNPSKTLQCFQSNARWEKWCGSSQHPMDKKHREEWAHSTRIGYQSGSVLVFSRHYTYVSGLWAQRPNSDFPLASLNNILTFEKVKLSV